MAFNSLQQKYLHTRGKFVHPLHTFYSSRPGSVFDCGYIDPAPISHSLAMIVQTIHLGLVQLTYNYLIVVLPTRLQLCTFKISQLLLGSPSNLISSPLFHFLSVRMSRLTPSFLSITVSPFTVPDIGCSGAQIPQAFQCIIPTRAMKQDLLVFPMVDSSDNIQHSMSTLRFCSMYPSLRMCFLDILHPNAASCVHCLGVEFALALK